MLHTLTGWLGDLPLGSLYIAIGVLSAFENFFPPFPSDAVIAFGSFLADRAHGSAITVFLLGWFGNVAGAGITYTLGRRFGSKAFMRRIEKYAGPDAEVRIKRLHKKYGFMGLFVSRFLPGSKSKGNASSAQNLLMTGATFDSMKVRTLRRSARSDSLRTSARR